MSKIHLKKNDKVKIICGKDRDKVGTVVDIYRKK